jgi:hypothetical protein
MDPDTAVFVIALQDANKELLFIQDILLITFLKLHLHHFSKIKSHKEVTKQWESRFFLLFSVDDRRIPIRTSD